MQTHVAFLRAINVAGHAVVKMDDLQKAFASAGGLNVRTYIQSGNVLFDADGDPAPVFDRIRRTLRVLLKQEPVILFRTLRKVERLVKRKPFGALVAGPKVKLYVVFLAQKPQHRPSLPLRSSKEALELVAVKNLEAYVVSGRKKNGFYGFPNNFIEHELGVTATSRNLTTLTRLVDVAV